jgi:hypothetical protein
VGDNTLETQTSGTTIQIDDVNQYKTALNGDVVPRNTSGVATDVAGSVGTSALRWLKGWFGSVGIGASASGISIEEDTGDPIIKRDSVEQFRLGPDGIQREHFGTLNYAVSASSTAVFVNNSTTWVDVTNLSVSITTTGKPVVVVVIPDGTSNTAGIGHNTNATAQYTGEHRLVNGASGIAYFEFRGAELGSSNIYIRPPGSIMYLDTSVIGAASTYTYKMQAQQSLGVNGWVRYEYCKLLAYEL